MTDYPLINCTNCGTPSPTTQQQGKYIDDGLDFSVNDIGYYGGFTDNFPPKYSYDLAHLCHDCCVILFNALPGFAKFVQVHGGHGNLNNDSDYTNGTLIEPCCQYAWTWDKTDKNNIIVYRATPELTWELMPESHEDEQNSDSKHNDPEWIAEKMFGEEF